ncbi:MAG: MATE family efflux transporter [Clostridiales bacterium]|nr:MATE family efflux transporter [Clostridiales bacterium]
MTTNKTNHRSKPTRQILNDLTTGSITGKLISFSLPFFITSALQAMYGAVDLFVVGRYTGTSAVSAVNIGTQVMQLITSILIGISVGTTVTLGRHIGEKDPRGCAESVGSSIAVFALMAAVFTPLLLLTAGNLVIAVQTPPEAVKEAASYITICALGIPFIAAYNVGSGIFRGLGDSKTPMYIIALACTVNIAFDFLFVRAFGWGAAGAAAATTLAQAVASVTQILYFLKNKLPFSFGRSFLKPVKRAVTGVLRVGVPLAVQDLLICCAFLALTIIANRRGLVSSSAVGVGERIIMFMFLVPSAMMSALSAITAQNVGAGKHDRAVRSTVTGMIITFVFGVISCGAAQLAPGALVGLFTDDPRVIEAGIGYIRSYSLDCILVAATFCLNGYLSGCDRAAIVFIHNTLSIFIIRIPLAYILSARFPGSLFPMGLASPLGTVFSTLFLCVYFLRQRAKKREPLPRGHIE